MATVLIEGYKISMRIHHALFYYFWGERRVPKNIHSWDNFMAYTCLWAITCGLGWILSWIPGLGIEMILGIFIATIFGLLYKPPGDLYRPLFVGGLAYGLYLHQITFKLTLLSMHLEPYYLTMVMGLCMLHITYRIYNRVIWFFNDRIIKRYKLPIPDQGVLQKGYFNRNYVKERSYRKSLTAYNNLEEAKALETHHEPYRTAQ